MDFDREEDLKSDFKEDWRSKKASSIKQRKIEENNRQHGRALGLYGRPPEAEIPHSRQAEKHGHLCA